MTDSSLHRQFFYADSDAEIYDETIELVAPYYRQMHEMMLNLAVENMPASDASVRKHVLALDIGSGTGAEAIPLLTKIPNLRLVGLDLCESMNEVFRENADEAGLQEEQYHLVKGDILDPSIGETLREAAGRVFGASQIHLIISGFTLHHFARGERKGIFQMVYDLLEPKGVFLLGDLFNYRSESKWLTQRIFDWEISWIAANFEQRAQDAEQAGNATGADHLRKLKDQWIQHYNEDNKLDGVTPQLRQLRQVGFREAGCPFRYWQVGLIGAWK